MGEVTVTQEMLAAKYGSIFPHLDERQRRLLLGAEARALGHGGIRLVARAAGVREATVSLGVDELESGAEPLGRARRQGGGRKPLADTDPGLVPALLALVEADERGDPMTPLRWTTKSTRNLAGELTTAGHPVSADTVDKLLHEQGFSLQGNAKTIEGKRHPDRVRDHDFPDEDLGKVTPYGIYDIGASAGWVNVGTDRDTAAFAVESIRRWWSARGRLDYPAARRLLISAGAGGSNGYRTRAWKAGLAALAAETGLEITCCHFPPGTSKWNKIEHRLFSAITMNWRGRPLASHEVVVNTIAATTTRTGLSVHAELDPGTYPAGVKISKAQMDALPLARHDWHGEWNYTLHPQAATAPAAPPAPAPRRPARPRPDLAWLAHPAITGIPAAALREAALDRRRGYRPRQIAPGTGPRPRHTLAGKLTAAILHDRHGLPQKAIAALFQTTPEVISRHTGDIRRLLHQAGHIIQPGPAKLATLDDLYRHATAHGITTPAEIKTAC